MIRKSMLRRSGSMRSAWQWIPVAVRRAAWAVQAVVRTRNAVSYCSHQRNSSGTRTQNATQARVAKAHARVHTWWWDKELHARVTGLT